MGYFRLKILNRLFVVYQHKMFKTTGINSKLKDGSHALFFDFDDTTLERVKFELRACQIQYDLPKIYIINTGKPTNFHAYCLRRTPFKRALQIVLTCPSIDMTFVRFAIWRGHFTLRVDSKNGRDLEGIEVLPSNKKESLTVNDFNSFTKYETASG
jgi:hypothetical protein